MTTGAHRSPRRVVSVLAFRGCGVGRGLHGRLRHRTLVRNQNMALELPAESGARRSCANRQHCRRRRRGRSSWRSASRWSSREWSRPHPSAFSARSWQSAATSAGFVTSCRTRSMSPYRCWRSPPAVTTSRPTVDPGRMDDARTAPGAAAARDLSDLGRSERRPGGKRCHGRPGDAVRIDRAAQHLVPDQPSGRRLFSRIGRPPRQQLAAFQLGLSDHRRRSSTWSLLFWSGFSTAQCFRCFRAARFCWEASSRPSCGQVCSTASSSS